jgi:adenylyltransferase/sulfurtransferase
MLKTLSEKDIQRYAHQIILKNIGIDGQRKLLISKVFILGMGGLGSPVSMYLASAGLGTLGIADFDHVEISNLQRQVLFDQNSINKSKVEVAKKKLLLINQKLKINIYKKKITKINIDKIIKDYDVVVDGSDNFQTKYLINDSCIKNKKTLVSAALRGFEAQITTIKGWIKSKNNPCYRCMFPEINKNSYNETYQDCGIVGGIAGIAGSLQSVEVIKDILGIGKNLVGELVVIDLLFNRFKKIKFKKDKKCTICN